MRQLLFFLIFLLISYIVIGQETGSFVDQRDGTNYTTVKIGNQVWMAGNLNYDAGSGCWCYDDDSRNCDQYGRLYSWETAKRACPDGWHLPTKSEFETLLSNYGGKGNGAYVALKQEGSSGFSALLGGYRYVGGEFSYLGSYGNFWSSSECSSETAWNLIFYRLVKDANIYFDSMSAGYSVRCLQDSVRTED